MSAPTHEAPVIAPRTEGPRSGILALRNAVAAYFADNAINAAVSPVGLKYRSFALNQSPSAGANRVVFIPGEFDGDPKIKARKYGALTREGRNAGSVVNPRELLSWARPITISIWSGPQPGQNQDEGLNVGIAEDLLEKVVQAVQVFGKASLHWGEILINAPPVENSFGAELLVGLTQIGPLYDITYDYVQATITPEGVLTR